MGGSGTQKTGQTSLLQACSQQAGRGGLSDTAEARLTGRQGGLTAPDAQGARLRVRLGLSPHQRR